MDPEKNADNQVPERGSLGEHLRQTRIGSRIDLQKMASDTKLNVAYINAIEKNKFERIPGETYRKIFIKNVAKYLALDPEEVYARYRKEFIKEPRVLPAAGTTTPEKPEKSDLQAPSRLPKQLIVYLLAVLAVFALIMVSRRDRQKQALPHPVPEQARQTDTVAPPPPAKTKKKTKTRISTPLAAKTEEKVKTAVAVPPAGQAEEKADTAAAVPPAGQAEEKADTTAAAPPPGEVKEKVTDTAAAPPAEPAETAVRRFKNESFGRLRIALSCKKDSVYVFAFRKGRLWSNIFYAGDSKIFAFDSAIYLNISNMRNARVSQDGRPLELNQRAGQAVRITEHDMTYLTKQDWETFLQNR
jgi:cytoskeletal protein RodZ